jgi:hypothetical protein
MKITYTARTADGRTFTRKSERTYTHASIVTMPHGKTYVKFASSHALAAQAAGSHFSIPRGMERTEMAKRMADLRAASTIEIVEVTA